MMNCQKTVGEKGYVNWTNSDKTVRQQKHTNGSERKTGTWPVPKLSSTATRGKTPGKTQGEEQPQRQDKKLGGRR